MGGDIKMKDAMRAIQEDVFEDSFLFSNNAGTVKNSAMMALTIVGKFKIAMDEVNI